MRRDSFAGRHIGPSSAEIAEMLAAVGQGPLESLSDAIIPASIRLGQPLDLPEASSEHELLARLGTIAQANRVCRSYVGMGYYGTLTPAVLQRNVLENPGWYTQYTPYQA